MIRGMFFFLVVFVVSVILGLGVPLALLIDRSGGMFAWILRQWSRCWLWSAGARLKVEGAEKLKGFGAAVLVGNHQSTLDIPIIAIAARGRIRFMAKKSLMWVPLIGQITYMAGFAYVDRKNPRKSKPAIDRMIKRLQKYGDMLVLYAEGTRSPDGRLQPYRRGSFHLAKKAGVPLIPFAIDGSYRVMHRDVWWPTAGDITVHIGDPISADEVAALHRDELLERTRAFALQFLPDSAEPADEPATVAAETESKAAPAQENSG